MTFGCEVVGVYVDRHRTTEPPFGFHVGPAPSLYNVWVGVDVSLGPGGRLLGVADQGGDEMPVRSVDLHPVVAPVRDINVAIGVRRDARGSVQVSDTGTTAFEHDLEAAFGVEPLHPVVLPVGHVNVPVRAHAYAPGEVEFTVALALLAEAAQE